LTRLLAGWAQGASKAPRKIHDPHFKIIINVFALSLAQSGERGDRLRGVRIVSGRRAFVSRRVLARGPSRVGVARSLDSATASRHDSFDLVVYGPHPAAPHR
jgi:hypothetical protein